MAVEASMMNGAAASESISVVIPVYRGADSLPELVAELARVLPTLTSVYEIVFVDDNSPDHSWRVIQELTMRYEWVRGYTLMRNYGQHNALLCGIRAAHHELIVTMDDDLQHPPEEIRPMLAKLREGYDVVYGTPEAEQHGLLRDLASQVTKLALQSSMGVDTARKVGAFRIFRAVLREAFTRYQSSYVSIDVLLTWATTRFSSVVVRHEARRYGASGYTFSKLVRHALNMITGFSILPLQIASLVGLGAAALGLVIFIYVIVNYFARGGVVPGFAFLAATVAILGGAQLFALGIIGEYLARIHFRTMERPVYTVRMTTDAPSTIEKAPSA